MNRKNQEIADLNQEISNQKDDMLVLKGEITKQVQQNSSHKG